ncbi:hypothetical protein DFH94DRAFT_705861 [Russula ochroleuca]|uniref:Uncharacterized protein n=1 Tax=Russula ochroleuca TaxID=152965 RepID=A0A9P5N6V3_9AGAM|nr:hypothetical protein DFH94DRAFT_705861 [Russula ochroleuca]
MARAALLMILITFTTMLTSVDETRFCYDSISARPAYRIPRPLKSQFHRYSNFNVYDSTSSSPLESVTSDYVYQRIRNRGSFESIVICE